MDYTELEQPCNEYIKNTSIVGIKFVNQTMLASLQIREYVV